MADVYTIQIIDTAVIDGTTALVPVTTGSYSLRLTPFGSATHNGTHLSKGVWSFGVVGDGVYQLWDESGTPSQMANYGQWEIIDNNPALAGLTMSGDIVMGSNKLTGLKAGSGAGDSVRYEDVLKLAGNHTIAGNNIHSGTLAVTGNMSVRTFSIATSYQGTMADAPTGSTSITNKGYVDGLIAALTVSAYQQASNIRRIIYGGTVESGKVYTDIATAIASCGSPTVENRFNIELNTGQSRTDGTVDLDNYYGLDINNIVSYVNIKGHDADQHLVLLNAATFTKVLIFENLNIYLGTNDVAGGRTMNSPTFKNCIIYAYDNLALTNVKLYNCLVYNASSFSSTLVNCLAVNTHFNQTITDTSGNRFVNSIDGFDTAFTMPTDPSLAP